MSKIKYWTTTEQRALSLLWERGVSVADIAAVLDRSMKAVEKQARPMNLHPPGRVRAIDPGD